MIITSRQNSIIKQFRKPNESIVVEGVKLITEALNAGFVLQYLLFTEAKQELAGGLFLSEGLTEANKNKEVSGLPGTVITSDLSEYISDTKTPQGIFAMFERKQNTLNFTTAKRIVLLDGVRDPANVGAIARSCEAFGLDGVVLSDNSADVYNPKVVRASAGSVFRLPNVRGGLSEIIPELKQAGFTIYASALDETADSLRETEFPDKTAVIIGSEGQGVSREALDLCDKKLYIPIKGAESLNAGVAAGIICYVIQEPNGELYLPGQLDEE
jgi:TrmH family RNA methyltransferase